MLELSAIQLFWVWKLSLFLYFDIEKVSENPLRMIRKSSAIPISVWYRLLWAYESGIFCHRSYRLQVTPLPLNHIIPSIALVHQKQRCEHNPNVLLLLVNSLFYCIDGKMRKSGYMSNAGLFERMRFLWRKARVWQSWVRIWAEDTSCTGRQHRRYPLKSQALVHPVVDTLSTTGWKNSRRWMYPLTRN